MKRFFLAPMICEYPTVSAFAESFGFNEDDLILTNEYIYRPLFSALNLRAQVLFQEQFGMGEPTDQMVDAILAALHTLHYKRIVAVGGGTIIDIAKILAVAEPGDYTDQLYDKMTQLTKVHPLFIIPTTCGTGSEVTNISIVNRTAKGVKQGSVSGAMYADQAILIPELLQSLPYKVFATSSIDAMIHAVESYLSPNASETSEMFSMQALKILLTAWREAAASEDKDAWKKRAAEYLRASNYAGIAFSNAGCGSVHALSYPLGGTYHVAHGESNQVMFAPVMQMYLKKAPEGKILDLNRALSPILDCAPENAQQALWDLMDQILPRKPMRAYGTTKDDLPRFTDAVIASQQRLLANNYVPLSREEILAIYESAF